MFQVAVGNHARWFARRVVDRGVVPVVLAIHVPRVIGIEAVGEGFRWDEVVVRIEQVNEKGQSLICRSLQHGLLSQFDYPRAAHISVGCETAHVSGPQGRRASGAQGAREVLVRLGFLCQSTLIGREPPLESVRSCQVPAAKDTCGVHSQLGQSLSEGRVQRIDTTPVVVHPVQDGGQPGEQLGMAGQGPAGSCDGLIEEHPAFG